MSAQSLGEDGYSDPSPAPLDRSALSSLFSLAALPLVDGVFLSMLLTHRFSSLWGAMGVGMTLFSGAGVLTAGRRLGGSLPLRLLLVALLFSGIALAALIYGFLVPLVQPLMLSPATTRPFAALLLVQIALLVLGANDRPEGHWRSVAGVVGGPERTVVLLVLSLTIHTVISRWALPEPHLPGPFPGTDTLALGTAACLVLAVAGGAAVLQLLLEAAGAREAGTLPCAPREVVDARASLLDLGIVLILGIVSLPLQGGASDLSASGAIAGEQMAGILIAVAAAAGFTMAGVAAFHLGDRWFHEGVLRLSGAASILCIAGAELHVPVPAWVSLAVLLFGPLLGAVLQARKERVAGKQPVDVDHVQVQEVAS